MLAIQYLGGGEESAKLDPAPARSRLREGFERLPISRVVLGWGLPVALVGACVEEARSRGAEIYRWHLLLAGDGDLIPRSEWGTVAVSGEPVPGSGESVDFTFLCPNRKDVRDAVLAHLADALDNSPYAGVMLDRIRLPSPVGDPSKNLGCFCRACHLAASAEGLDLAAIQAALLQMLSAAEGRLAIAAALVSWDGHAEANDAAFPLADLLAFRERSVTRLVGSAARLAQARGLRVGLDCFSPVLTRAVGQDLGSLDACSDWIKIMCYGHTLGPAGIPFELLGLAEWLVAHGNVTEKAALQLLAGASGLPLPDSRAALEADGLSTQALATEVRRGRSAVAGRLLAGLELVEMEGVSELDDRQIAADVRGLEGAGIDGFVLSWDLWHIPLERLDVVATSLGVSG